MLGELRDYIWQTRHIKFDLNRVTDYNFDNCNLGFDPRIAYKCFEEVQLYNQLKFLPGALQALNKLQSVIRVVPYTCVPNVQDVYNQRRDFIRKYFGFGEPVAGFRKPVDMHALALFDDCVGNHQLWIRYGQKGRKYLIHSLCNRFDNSLGNNAIRCQDFKSAVDKFIKDYR